MTAEQKMDRLGVVAVALLLMGTGLGCGTDRTEAPPGRHDHSAHQPVAAGDPAIDYWTCTMHPSVKMKDSGTCPICSMDLEPVRRGGIRRRRQRAAPCSELTRSGSS